MPTCPPSPIVVALALLPSLLLAGCGQQGAVGQRCACEGHGVQLCEDGDCSPCQCLALAPATVDPVPATTFSLSADEYPDWALIDDALKTGDVRVSFDPTGTWSEQIDVLRTDTRPSRLVLDGGAGEQRAAVPGISTGYDDIPRRRVTVRGFNITGSKNKGIYWRAGDEVLIEDVLVHDNKGSPAVAFEYANRTGLSSTNFTLRNSHIWSQHGEGIYIGGAKGNDEDAHQGITIEHNLIHDQWSPWTHKTDGINIKDRLGTVVVDHNVIFNTHWGIEAASPGTYTHNLIWRTTSNGLHLTDQWGLGMDGSAFQDNTVIASETRVPTSTPATTAGTWT